MADDPATKPIEQQAKSIEQKGGNRPGDSTTKLAGPSKSMEEKEEKRSGDSTAKLAGPSKMSKLHDQELDLQRQRSLSEVFKQELSKYKIAESERTHKGLEGVLLHTQRLTVCGECIDAPFRLGREGEKSGRNTVLRGDAGRKLHVIEWMSTDDKTHLVLWDHADHFQNVISILAPLCPAVKHFSTDFYMIHSLQSTHIPTPMPMKSVITVCLKSWRCYKTLHEALLAVSNFFPNAESLDARMEKLRSPSDQAYSHEVNSSSSLRGLKLRCEDRFSSYHGTMDSLLMDISTSCPNIVSLVLSGFERYLSNKSGKEITSFKMPHLTNIQLEPLRTDDCCRFEPLLNVLHVVHVTSPHLKLVKAKKVQLGEAELTSVKWSRTSSGCELQLEGSSAAVPMADLMHLVSNELERVTVLTFDRCKVDIPQSTSHPPQSTGEKISLRELKFLNVESPLSQTDILKLSEMYPNVKVTVEHESQALHEDSKQGTRIPFIKPERKTFPSSPLSLTSSIDEVNVKPIKMECCKRVGVEGGRLQLDSFGIELEIPPGAIDSEAPQEISLRVLTDTPNLGNIKEEMSVCFGVQCLAPDDLVLKLPVTYTIPHCAVITGTQYPSVEAVLYTGEGEYSPDAVVKERIMLLRSGIPSCIITKDVLKLKMNHFSWVMVKIKSMIRNFFFQEFSFQGKKMCCRPFREKNLALQKTPVILHAHLYDDIKGNSEFVKSQEGEEEFVPAHMEQQVLIKAEGDLKMTCYVKETVIGKPAVVSFEKLKSGARICEPFELDFTDQPDVVAVSLKVGQIERLQVNLLFRLDFSTPDRRERTSPQDPEQLQGTSSSDTLQTSHRSKCETVENISGRQKDFDEKLRAVAQSVVKHGEIDDLGKALCFTADDIQRYVDTNMKNAEVSYMGTLSMLRKWRDKQTKATECEALKNVLTKAGKIHLADELFGTS